MESDEQYARRQIRQFKADSVAQIVAPGLRHSRLLVSRLRRDTPGHGFATPTRPDAVFSVLVQLRQQDRRELFLEDRLVHKGMFAKGTVSVVNHWQRPKANLLSAFDTIIFTVPQSALTEAAEDQGVRPIEGLVCEIEGRLDQTVWNLTQSLLPALERPEEVGTMYAERVLLACTTYFAHAFSGMRPAAPAPHGLSPSEIAGAIDLMLGGLSMDLSLTSLAAEVNLSPRQFAKAFRRTTGETPDNWLRRRRIERAKTMLRETTMPLTQIATRCGFLSASHLSRVFASVVGVGPTVWRAKSLN